MGVPGCISVLNLASCLRFVRRPPSRPPFPSRPPTPTPAQRDESAVFFRICEDVACWLRSVCWPSPARLVDEHRGNTRRNEVNETYSLCHFLSFFLPGPNVSNLSVCVVSAGRGFAHLFVVSRPSGTVVPPMVVCPVPTILGTRSTCAMGRSMRCGCVLAAVVHSRRRALDVRRLQMMIPLDSRTARTGRLSLRDVSSCSSRSVWRASQLRSSCCGAVPLSTPSPHHARPRDGNESRLPSALSAGLYFGQIVVCSRSAAPMPRIRNAAYRCRSSRHWMTDREFAGINYANLPNCRPWAQRADVDPDRRFRGR